MHRLTDGIGNAERSWQVEVHRGTHKWRSFTTYTTKQLEEWYKATDGGRIFTSRASRRASVQQLADACGLTEEQVQTWTENKRRRHGTSKRVKSP